MDSTLEGTMRHTQALFVSFVLIVSGAAALVPPGTAIGTPLGPCGFGAMHASSWGPDAATPSPSTPTVFAVFKNQASACGVLRGAVSVDGGSVGSASSSTDPATATYRVWVDVASPLPPGPHVAIVELREHCCNVAGMSDIGLIVFPFIVAGIEQARPVVSDDPDGWCTAWLDYNGNNVHDRFYEDGARAPCPDPKQKPGSPATIYDDMDDDDTMDPDETITNPRLLRHMDGTCEAYNDMDDDGVLDTNEPTSGRIRCPNPKTTQAADGSTVVFDDKDNDGANDPGEQIAASPVLAAPNPKLKPNSDGSTTLYDDRNNNDVVDPGEALATAPGAPLLPNVKTTRGADGSIIVYDDKDNDNAVGAGETIAVAPRTTAPAIDPNLDGSCTVYDDFNGNGARDAGESALAHFPCPNPAIEQRPDGGLMVYDDKNRNAAPDTGETITTVGGADSDGDRIPDSTEAEICGPPGNRELLSTFYPNLGQCHDGSSLDYEAPSRFGGVNLAMGVVGGDDADADGFPVTVTLKRLRITINPFDSTVVKTEAAPDLVLPVDEDDLNPNVPALSTSTVPVPIVVGYALGPDNDADGVSSTLTLLKVWYSFDRRPGTSGSGSFISTTEAPSEVHQPDPNDADPNVPAQSIFGPFLVPVEAWGTDVDQDRIPGTFTVRFLNLTVDRRPGHPTTSLTSHTESYQLAAEDDQSRGSPVPFDATDTDGDDIPDSLEPALCSRQNDNRPEDGTCPTADKQDYYPPLDAPNPWRRS